VAKNLRGKPPKAGEWGRDSHPGFKVDFTLNSTLYPQNAFCPLM